MVWLKLSDAANRLGLSEITLRRRVKNGKVMSEFREGKYFVKISEDSLDNTSINKDLEPQRPLPVLKTKPTLSTLSQTMSPLEVQQLAQLRAALTEKISTIEIMKRKIENQETLINVLENKLKKKLNF